MRGRGGFIKNSRRNPKGPKFTPAQEAEYERYEHEMARARIFELGVSAFLSAGGGGGYASPIESEEASNILRAAVEIRKRASEGRAEIRREAEAAEAAPAKRTRKAKAK